jgi:hypothetical protein
MGFAHGAANGAVHPLAAAAERAHSGRDDDRRRSCAVARARSRTSSCLAALRLRAPRMRGGRGKPAGTTCRRS